MRQSICNTCDDAQSDFYLLNCPNLSNIDLHCVSVDLQHVCSALHPPIALTDMIGRCSVSGPRACASAHAPTHAPTYIRVLGFVLFRFASKVHCNVTQSRFAPQYFCHKSISAQRWSTCNKSALYCTTKPLTCPQTSFKWRDAQC